MALVTGTPVGNSTVTEDLYLEGAPNIYFQDYRANPLKNPDADGFYWGMSGTATYPYYEIGCPLDVSFTESLTMNDVRCDNVGVKDTIQQRDYVELQMTVQSIFPFDVLRHMVKGGAVTETSPTQKFGLGPVDNTLFYMVYTPKVYDETAGDYFVVHLHKAKFVDAWTLNTPYGASWQLTGIRLRAYADTTKPTSQKFGVFVRSDLSVIT